MSEDIVLDSSQLNMLDSEVRAVAPSIALRGFGFISLWRLWTDFIEEVETGYDHTIFEYDDDVGLRLIIERILARIPAQCAQGLRDQLEHWDSRFFAATEEVSRQFGITGASDEERWWLSRLPRHPVGALKEDIDAGSV